MATSNPAYTRTLSRDGKDLPRLLEMADLIRELQATHAWKFVQAQIAAREQHELARLLNESTKPEEIPRLRGLVSGLASMREAAESIVAYAEDAEREANKRINRETLV